MDRAKIESDMKYKALNDLYKGRSRCWMDHTPQDLIDWDQYYADDDPGYVDQCYEQYFNRKQREL